MQSESSDKMRVRRTGMARSGRRVCGSILVVSALCAPAVAGTPRNHVQDVRAALVPRGYRANALDDISEGVEIPDRGSLHGTPLRWFDPLTAPSLTNPRIQHQHGMEDSGWLSRSSELFSRNQSAAYRFQLEQRIKIAAEASDYRKARELQGQYIHYMQDVPYHTKNLEGVKEDVARETEDRRLRADGGDGLSPRIAGKDELITLPEHADYDQITGDDAPSAEVRDTSIAQTRLADERIRDVLTDEQYNNLRGSELGLPPREEIEAQAEAEMLDSWRKKYGPDARFERQPDGYYRLLPNPDEKMGTCGYRRNHVVRYLGPDEPVYCEDVPVHEDPYVKKCMAAGGTMVDDPVTGKYACSKDFEKEAMRDVGDMMSDVADANSVPSDWEGDRSGTGGDAGALSDAETSKDQAALGRDLDQLTAALRQLRLADIDAMFSYELSDMISGADSRMNDLVDKIKGLVENGSLAAAEELARIAQENEKLIGELRAKRLQILADAMKTLSKGASEAMAGGTTERSGVDGGGGAGGGSGMSCCESARAALANGREAAKTAGSPQQAQSTIAVLEEEVRRCCGG